MCIFQGQRFERIETGIGESDIQLPIVDWKRELLPEDVLIGWRAWGITQTRKGVPRLISPHTGHVWLPSKPMRARASLLVRSYPYGVFAYLNRYQFSPRYAAYAAVYGEVALWGHVIRYERKRAPASSVFENAPRPGGFIAEFAAPVSLYCRDKGLASSLRRFYRVPVHVPDTRNRWVEV